MQVVLWAFGSLRRYLTDYVEDVAVELPPGTMVADVLSLLGVPVGEVGLIAVNGQLSSESACLRHGDRVEIFSPMEGGDRS